MNSVPRKVRKTIDEEGHDWVRPGEHKQCVEVSDRGDHVFLRDSKTPNQHIQVAKDEFLAFIEGVKMGDLD